MYNIKLSGLDTDQEYYVKVRAKVNGLETSEWSLPFKFRAPKDTMPPGRIENLSFLSEGDSFVAKWDTPSINEDGSPCADVSYFELELRDLNRDALRRVRTSETNFSMDFNQNKSMFGLPAGKIELTVRAVDLSGNIGKPVVAIAQNPPPAQVKNVTAAVSVESIALKWEANTENDLANYEIHVGGTSGFTPSGSTLRAKVAPGTDSFTYDTASLSILYFKILAVDKFNQKSEPSDVVSAQPRLTTDYDKEPPETVTGFAVTQVLAADNASATAQINYTAVADTDLDKYEVQYRKTGETTLPWAFAVIPSDQTTAEIKPLPLNTDYDFRIRGVDFNSNKGDWSAVVVAPGVKKTTLPAAPTDVTVRGGMSNLMVTWTASTDPSMSSWAGTYEVQISKETNFSSPTTIKTSSTLASFINLDQNTVYYVRVRAIDPYNNTGAWSSTANGNTGTVADANASRVIWSETEPVDGKTNDLWIKVPDNVQYRFDGTDWIKAQDTELAGEIDNVRQTADGKNKAWYQTTKPPATNNTQGDIWFDTANGNKLHVWSISANDWVSAQDAAIQDALDDAADALQTADGKNTIFYTAPASGVTPREGDTWFDNAVIKVYKNGAWVNASDDLDTAKARQAIQIAGSKNKTYYVAKDSATDMIEGDILFDTADGNKQYRYNGTAWVSVQDAAIEAAENAAGQAQETADKKNTIYYSTPPTTGLRDGDTWFDGPTIKTYRNGVWTDSSSALETQQGADAIQVAGSKNKTYYTTYANRPTTGLTEGDLLFDTGNKYKQYRYTNSGWLSVQDGTIADAKTAADNAKAAAEQRAQTFYEANKPANTNSRLKVNDLWIRSTDNQLHRWTGSDWMEIQDDAIALTQSNLTTAVGDLQTSIGNVQAIADGKINTFISNVEPTEGLDEGDIWFDTSIDPVATKVYDGTNWVVSGDKAALDAAAAVQQNLNATNANVNKKNTTYAQTSAPTAGLIAGDLWLDTTLVSGTPKNEMNRWDGDKWVKTQDKLIFDAQALADGKAKVFTKNSMPTNAESENGDIWFDVRDTPWSVKVRNGVSTWVESGDKNARDAAIAAQTEAERKIQSFYTDTDPATVTANNVKPGDLWYKTSDKRARVRAANNTWVELKDADIKKAQDAADAAQASANTAITNAGNAFDLADGKAKVYWQPQPGPTGLVAADEGDIWVNTSKTPNEINVWSGTTWTVTGDPATKTIAEAAQTLAGQKSYVYTQTTQPTTSSNPKPTRGDTWIHTTTGETKIYTGSAWVAMTDPEAQTIANRKITTYYNDVAPTAPSYGFSTGDLWVRTTDNRLHRWSGAWVELKDKSITDLEALTDDIIDDLIPGLETQLDKKIEVYVQNDAPAITDAAKQKGDIWIRPANGEVKVYSGTAWVVSADPAAKALANTAQTTADKKMQTFYGSSGPANSPVGTLKVNDLWIDSDNNRLHRWNGSKWEEVKDADITAAEQAAATANQAVGNLAGTVSGLETQVDKKVEVWFQTNQPAVPSAAADRLKMKGDIWINTSTGASNGEVKMYPGTGTVWNVVTDPAAIAAAQAAKDVADSKRQVFGGELAPSNTTGTTGNNLQANDLWIRDSDKKMHRWTGSVWEVAQDYKIDAAAQKGNNLVFNGHGELGDTTNWSGSVTYSASDAPPGSKGSFVIAGNKNVSLSEPISINPFSNYTLSVWARRLNEVDDYSYMYLVPFDAYNRSIAPGHYMYRPGSTTQLTADLKPGDTSIQVTSTANWYVGTSTNYYVTFWDYTDPGGKLWPKETYTRNIYTRQETYDAAAGPLPATSIPLVTPWAGPLKPAGTWLSSGMSGGSYMYNALAATRLEDEWTFYKSGVIGGLHDTPNLSAVSKFPPGTAFIKIGFLANWERNAGAVAAFSGIDFSDVNAAQDMATSAMESANARNRSIFSTGNATGTSLNGYSFINGDMWYRRDSNNTIIGMWEFANGSWVSKTLNNQVIANLDAGKINAGTINADRIGAGTITSSKLQIGDSTNMIPNNGWESPTTDWNIINVTLAVGDSVRYARFNTAGIVNTLVSPSFALQPGEYTMEFETRKIAGSSGTALMSALIETQTLSGSRIAIISAASGGVRPSGTSWEKFSGTITIPDTTQRGRVWLETGATGNHGMDVRFLSLKKKVGTTLIEDGAITTQKVHAEAITASELAAGAVTADKIKANEIDASKIVSGGMDGSVVIEEGTITATEIAGQTITGDKIKGNTIDAGHIKAGSITIGATSPIAPGTVATPSDVSTAKSEAISTAAGDATTKANAAQTAAINAAAADAQAKADAAKTAAENAAKAYADGEIDAATAQALIDAANTAQSKADAAKTAAQNAAKSYTDGQVGPINTTLDNWGYGTDVTYIDGGKIYTGTVTAKQIKALTITAAEIAAGAVEADKIKSKTITTEQIAIGGLDGDTVIANGTITTDKIDAKAITGAKIAANTITVGNMGPDSVDRTVIKDGEIITAKLAANAVKAGNIDAGAITADKIAAGSITIGGTTGHIPSGAIAGSGEVVPKASNGSGTKIFRDIVAWRRAAQNLPGIIVIKTAMTFDNYMFNIEINGYNYRANSTNGADINLSVSGYAYSVGTQFYNMSANNRGGTPVEASFYRTDDTVPQAAIVLRHGVDFWSYPQINVTEASISGWVTPDTLGQNWSIEYYEDESEISGWTKFNPALSLDQGTVSRIADGWRYNGTTTINGGKIEADTITAAQIRAGSITIGPNAPIAPGTVAIPSDVSTAKTEAIDAAASDATTKANNAKTGAESTAKSYTDNTVAPINTTIGNWKYGNTTFINGGSIYTRSITADRIEANSLTASEIAANAITASELAANSVLAGNIKAGEITGDKLATNTAVINNLQIQSALTINAAGGHIKSSNWNDTNKTGFYMDQQQLIVHDGRIEASAIRLQDSSNIMPPLYASFNANESAYGVAKFWRGSLSSTTKVANDGKFGGGSVQFAITSNTGFVGMGSSATDLNIPIEGGNQYIISFYVSNRSSKAITLQPELYQTSSITIKGTATSITNTTAWRRYSVVVTAPASMTRAILRFNLTAGATATFKLDGIQVEQKTGAVDTPSNWSPPGYTSIDGESITTGSISSSATARTNSAIAAWSIDTQGRARFGDVTVNGKIIVGEEVSNKEATSIQSDTYSAGTAGWAIKGNGDVEFNNGTFRGILNLGTAVNESVKPTMTASVSSIKLYTDETTSKDIDVASIQGVTYAYSRTDETATGTFVPDLPNEDKAARYYFGPTTDKAVNIQVHDGPEDRAVYVSNPPTGVTLTSLRIGELTNPGAAPLDREKQGFGYVSTRAETDPDTPSRKTSIRVEQSSGVQLRSPFYPEVTEGKEYPESTHILRTDVDFKAPLNKNLIHFSTALPDANAYRSVIRTGRTDYSAGAYELRNVIGKAAHFDVSAGTATATKKHIFSTYVDTLDATDDVAIYAFANGTPLKPLGDNVLAAGQTAYEYAPDYRSPDYRYEFETSTTSYSNVGTGTQALTRTHGSPGLNQPGALGASGNVRYTAAANYNLTNGMSLSMWILPTPSSGTQVIFHRSTDLTRELWINWEAGTRTFSGGLSTGTAWTWAAPGNLVPDEWTHVTIVIPRATSTTGNIVIYINGEAKWTSDTIPTNRWNLSFSTQPYYLFGNMQLNSFYHGAISEPMIFHRMIQPADVSAIYNSGNKVPYLTGGNATQSENGILVGTGDESNRVAFEYTPTTSTATNVKVQMVGPTGNKVFIYKLQLEKASHLENNSLPPEIKNRVAPTPWTTNGSSATSSAALTLRSEPATDAESWTYGSIVKRPRDVTLTEEASKRKSPAELELTLTSSYTYTGGPSAGMIAGATYKWSTTGVSYPGSPFPYLPTAANIYWDYTDLTSSSRPQIGGSSSYLRRTINDMGSSLGAISVGVGRSIRDNFNRSDESTLGYPWMREGNPAFYLINNYTRRRAYGGVQTGIPQNFVYHSDQLETINQEVSIKSSDSSANFTTWRNNTVLICNYDPGSGDGIFFRNKDHSADRKWELIVRAGGVITYSTGGTYSAAMSDGTVLTLSRDGNRLTAKKGSTTYFNSTVSATLPTGQAVGFATDSGINDDFTARDLVPGSSAFGSLRPESINVNNNRGIRVLTSGMITVSTPGYYMLTASVGADFGGHVDRTYWLTAREWVNGYISGGYRDHKLGGPQNRGVNDFGYISGSVVAYMTGSIELVVETDTSHVSRINWAELQLVRVA